MKRLIKLERKNKRKQRKKKERKKTETKQYFKTKLKISKNYDDIFKTETYLSTFS